MTCATGGSAPSGAARRRIWPFTGRSGTRGASRPALQPAARATRPAARRAPPAVVTPATRPSRSRISSPAAPTVATPAAAHAARSASSSRRGSAWCSSGRCRPPATAVDRPGSSSRRRDPGIQGSSRPMACRRSRCRRTRARRVRPAGRPRSWRPTGCSPGRGRWPGPARRRRPASGRRRRPSARGPPPRRRPPRTRGRMPAATQPAGGAPSSHRATRAPSRAARQASASPGAGADHGEVDRAHSSSPPSGRNASVTASATSTGRVRMPLPRIQAA